MLLPFFLSLLLVIGLFSESLWVHSFRQHFGACAFIRTCVVICVTVVRLTPLGDNSRVDKRVVVMQTSMSFGAAIQLGSVLVVPPHPEDCQHWRWHPIVPLLCIPSRSSYARHRGSEEGWKGFVVTDRGAGVYGFAKNVATFIAIQTVRPRMEQGRATSICDSSIILSYLWLSSASGAAGYPSISGMPRTLENNLSICTY
eukprot:Gb_11094 [translate_table: standard]